jgi:hypothetical protein
MHCFIPYDLYNDDRHKALVQLMRAECPCVSVLSLVGHDDKGIHFYTWDKMDKNGPVYDLEEPITTVMIAASATNHITLP